MREYQEILNELNEYKHSKYEEVSKRFKVNDIIETLDTKKFGYIHARIRYIWFDDKTGEYYINVKENKHSAYRWSSCSLKTSIHKEDFDLIKVVANPVLDCLEELENLNDYLNYEIDKIPMTASERENKINDTEWRIKEIQHMCIHEYEEIEEGSWSNKKRIGYKCKICGLFDEDREA